MPEPGSVADNVEQVEYIGSTGEMNFPFFAAE
jgi:hypothetical protein